MPVSGAVRVLVLVPAYVKTYQGWGLALFVQRVADEGAGRLALFPGGSAWEGCAAVGSCEEGARKGAAVAGAAPAGSHGKGRGKCVRGGCRG